MSAAHVQACPLHDAGPAHSLPPRPQSLGPPSKMRVQKTEGRKTHIVTRSPRAKQGLGGKGESDKDYWMCVNIIVI